MSINIELYNKCYRCKNLKYNPDVKGNDNNLLMRTYWCDFNKHIGQIDCRDKFISIKSPEEIYEELINVVNEIRPYYDVDKIKHYSVYIWIKEDEFNWDEWNNVFDIEAYEIVMYDKKHKIIKEALPIIEKIQVKLRELQEAKISEVQNEATNR